MQKKLFSSRQIFRYAVPARTVTKSTVYDSRLHMSATNRYCHYCVKMAEPIELVFGTQAFFDLSYIAL